MTLPSVDRLPACDPAFCVALRERLHALGFDHAFVRRAEAISSNPLRYASSPVVRWWLCRQRTPAADLALLLAFDGALPKTRAQEHLGAELLSGLRDAGILFDVDDRVRSAFLLYPMAAGPLVLSDRLWGGDSAAMGPGAGTAFVANLVPPGFTGSVLDVGCGAGSLALAAALRGAKRVVGVDINPRAIELARFNAVLNGVTAEFRAGDLTKPVRGERFDRVVAQPAFVARPAHSTGLTYLHGGTFGDELSLRLLGECPGVLAEGGRATVLFQSPVRDGSSVTGRMRDALGAAAKNVDTLALRMEGAPPALQAMVFASYESAAADEIYAEAVAKYLEHFEANQTKVVEGVLAVLSAPARRNRVGARYAIALPFDSSSLTPDELDALLRRLELTSHLNADLALRTFCVPADLRIVTDRSLIEPSARTVRSIRFGAGSTGISGEISELDLARLKLFAMPTTIAAAAEAHARDMGVEAGASVKAFTQFVRDSLVRGRLAIAD